MMSRESLIQVEDVRKVYGVGEIQVAALDGVSLEIETGEYVAIMGPSGSGMSTMMHIAGLLDSPTEGRYELEGEDVSSLSRVKRADIRNRRIGFIFQSYNSADIFYRFREASKEIFGVYIFYEI